MKLNRGHAKAGQDYFFNFGGKYMADGDPVS